jgi:HTH-type transcriptional regulator, sugar sensing transcriptional regulator
MDLSMIKDAGLTDAEAKVYLALLKHGSTTTGPLLFETKVANSIIYRILDSLISKGLASYIIKEKTKYFQAADPTKLIEYIDTRKNKLEESRDKIQSLLPQLMMMNRNLSSTSVRVYEGFKGIQTAFCHYHDKLRSGDELYSWGVYPEQEEKYHLLWQRDHVRRGKEGINNKLLFNQGTDRKILKNRNSYKLCEARYMPTAIKTKAWFMVYQDVTLIALQCGKELSIEIINQEIADTFKAYFIDLWKASKPFN